MIDVTMPCTIRPDIIKQTLESFRKFVNCSSHNFQFIVNIDLAPKDEPNMLEKKAYMIEDLVKNFGDVKKMRIGYYPNFAIACKWLWQNTTSEYIFHLEDDWEFLKPIHLNSVIEQMINKECLETRFPKVNAPKFDRVTCQPCLWYGPRLRKLADNMITTKDPEKQMRIGSVNEKIDELLPGQGELLDWPNGPYCRDLGREWSKARGLVKWNKNIDRKEITWTYQN